MSVDPATAKAHVHHDGLDYYFCSAECGTKFVANPNKYVARKAAPLARHGSGRHDLHLPDAPANQPGGSGLVPDPCALGIATPVSITVGVGKGASLGLLIKNAEALERPEKVDTLVVDKTCTLTEGKPAVTSIRPVLGQDEIELLRLAASLERASEHPLARAIVMAATERKLALTEPSSVPAPAGKCVPQGWIRSTTACRDRNLRRQASIAPSSRHRLGRAVGAGEHDTMDGNHHSAASCGVRRLGPTAHPPANGRSGEAALAVAFNHSGLLRLRYGLPMWNLTGQGIVGR